MKPEIVANPASALPSILELREVCVQYGSIVALPSMSFAIPEGQIVTLIGANGAGKSSTLRAISALIKIRHGEIRFQGQPIHKAEVHHIVAKGISHVPEGRGIFTNLTVEENLDLGAWTAPDPKSLKEDLDRIFGLFPRLYERRKQNAGTLSGGEQQMLAIGRALMAHPQLLLLDEPSLGLAPLMIEKIFSIIESINKQGMTILLVEQNANQALQIADYGLVLETGQIVAADTGAKLLKSDFVHKAYLGQD